MNPTRKTKENIISEFPKPPKTETSAPTKNTAAEVKILPILKQNPVAVARTETGKRRGI